MRSSLHRALGAIGYPVIALLFVLWAFEPQTVLGVRASTVGGVALTGFMAWGAIVNAAYRAWWGTAGFLAMTAIFGVQFLTDGVVRNPAVIVAVVGSAVLLLLVGNARDDPAEPPRLTGR